LQVTHTSSVAVAERPLSAFMGHQSEPANNGFGAKSEVCRVVINAPWPPLRRPCGIHRRTAGLLACSVSPTPPSRTLKKSSGQKSVGTPLTVAGAATDQRKGLPCSLFTLGRNRGTVLGVYVPASRGVVKWSANRFRVQRRWRTAPPMAQSLRRGRLRTSTKDRPGLQRADLRMVWGANLEAQTKS
jgi:hypothetical protein